MTDLLARYREGSFSVRRDDLAAAVVTGPDRVRWLNGMVSTDVAKVGEGRGLLSLAVGRTGKIMAEFVMIARGETLVLLMAKGIRDAVVTHFAHHLIMDDAEISPLDSLRVVQVVGSTAGQTMDTLRSERRGDAHALVATGAGDDGFFLVDSNAPSVLELSDDAPEVEAVRVARGLPRFGVDYNETHYPQEALLEKTHVAFDKGCYLGQEVVCMLELRGHVKRKLALVTMGSTAPAGTPVASLEGVPVGELHGAAPHACEAGKTLAFVMVKVAFAELGRELRVGEQVALVVAPPLAAVTP